MKKGGIGGGLTKSGLLFEEVVDVHKTFDNDDKLSLSGNTVLMDGEKVAEIVSKHELYRFLKSKDIDHKKIISKQLLPDMGILVYKTNTFYIFEVKYQSVEGSVDEKLQTCDFKIKQYIKLLNKTLGYDVRYTYVLNDWFKDPKYKDVLEYIKSVNGCDYIFGQVSRKYIDL